jgi:hypothetical protein
MQKPVKDFGICSTSKVRPFLKSPTALSVYTVAIGFVPTSVHALVEKGASIRHICLKPNSIRDQRVHQSRFI